MSHYPSTSELQAFRRSIEGPHHTLVASPDHGGAWSYEREHGIGYRLSARGNVIHSAYDRGQHARREASAMRSRAYAAPMGKDACLALWASAQRYAPGTHPMSDVDRFWDDEQPRSPLPIAYRNPIAQA